jgi:prepilin-type N-terminal cleavage/methylation domain-containing protein
MRNASGFTFVELLVVLGLLSILLLVSVPTLSVPATLDASALARTLAVDMRLARQLAIARRTNFALALAPATPPFTTYTVRNASTLVDEPDFPKQIPPGIAVGGRSGFIFFPAGCVDDSGGGTNCIGTDGTVTIAVGGTTYQVQVFWYNGRVKVVRL